MIFGISGCSASGKSFIVDYLKKNISSSKVSFIYQDNYYKKREDQSKDENGNYNFEKWYEKLRLNINEEKPIILICRTGRRTKIIAEMMDKKLDNVIYNAKDGITSWIDAKLPIIKLKR